MLFAKPSRAFWPFFVAIALFSFVLILSGCGGHTKVAAAAPTVPSPTPSPTPSPSPASTVAQIRFGDDPVDSILAFEVSVAEAAAIPESGNKATIGVPKTNRLELSHTASKFEALMNLTVPQGTYTGLELTLADPAVTYVYTPGGKGDYLSSSHAALVSQDFPGTQVVTINFESPLVVGTDPIIFNLDFNIANTLVLSGKDAHEITGVDFTKPNAFAVVTKPIGPADKQQHKDGELEDVVGTVTSVNGSSFALLDGQSGGILDPVNLDLSAKIHDSLDNVVPLSDVLGRVVEIEGYTATNGTFTATDVELLAGKTGASVEGVILDTGDSFNTRNLFSLGHQSKSFSLLAQDGTGNGAQIADVGWTFTIHTDYLNQLAYEIDYGKCDWSGISDKLEHILFPFDATHLFPGQRVMVQTSSALPDGDFTHFTGTGVELAQQAVTGKITKWFSPKDGNTAATLGADYDTKGTWFVLELPRDSSVAALSGSDHVLVYAGPATDIEFLDANTDKVIGEGSLVRVRGLMFMPFNDWSFPRALSSETHFGTFLTMVARRIAEQQAPVVCATGTNPCN